MKEGGRFGDRRGALGGDYWAIATYLAVPAVGLLLLATVLPPDAGVPETRARELRARIHDRSLALQEWPRLLAELCRDPRLLEAGLAPSCADGTITLEDADCFDPTTREIRPEMAARLRRAMPVLLDALRDHERVWSQLDRIEVRGHADRQAVRDPYVTNLQASQQRATRLVAFLATDPGLPEADRRDLRRLAIASGASHVRPPPDCRVRSPECDDRARRVEIHLAMDAERLRARIGELHDELMDALAP